MLSLADIFLNTMWCSLRWRKITPCSRTNNQWLSSVKNSCREGSMWQKFRLQCILQLLHPCGVNGATALNGLLTLQSQNSTISCCWLFLLWWWCCLCTVGNCEYQSYIYLSNISLCFSSDMRWSEINDISQHKLFTWQRQNWNQEVWLLYKGHEAHLGNCTNCREVTLWNMEKWSKLKPLLLWLLVNLWVAWVTLLSVSHMPVKPVLIFETILISSLIPENLKDNVLRSLPDIPQSGRLNKRL